MREEISDTEHNAAMNLKSSMMLLSPVTRTTDNGSGNSSGGPPAGTLSLALNADVIQKNPFRYTTDGVMEGLRTRRYELGWNGRGKHCKV